PVLVNGMHKLDVHELPDSLRKLAAKEWHEVHYDPHFDADVDLLIRRLGGVPSNDDSCPIAEPQYWDQREGRRRGRWALLISLVAVCALWLWRDVLPPAPIDQAELGQL